jgi:tetratricopeptide (TPR) repeat protein
MDDYEALYQKGERLRRRRRPAKAIRCYEQALAIGGEYDTAIKHMTGVCYAMTGETERAICWYQQALRASRWADEAANIRRDLSQAYHRQGDMEAAESQIRQSLDNLDYCDFPTEYAASLGYLAELEMDEGDEVQALRYFAVADAILHIEGSREPELYHKLRYAAALARANRWASARWVAAKALLLALRYGSASHVAQALALMTISARAAIIVRRSQQKGS